MAEVLGIVAGGLGIVSVAIQVADSIKKLRDFCDLIKEAPEDVRLTLDELEALSDVLQDIEHSIRDSSKQSNGFQAAVLRSLRLCQSVSDSLKFLAQEIQNDLANKKRWASLKAALKSDKIVKLRRRLEGMKTTLMLANQCYYAALQRAGLEEQRRDMKELKWTMSTIAQADVTMCSVSSVQLRKTNTNISDAEDTKQRADLRDTQLTTENSPWRLSRSSRMSGFFGAVEYRKVKQSQQREGGFGDSSKDRDDYHEISVTVQLPLWLSGSRYQLRSKRAYGGWDYTIRWYTIVPYESPIFDLCYNGDLNAVQQLFHDGLASPFDISINGTTLLHRAVSGGNIEIVRYLLRCGLDINSRIAPDGDFEFWYRNSERLGYPGYSSVLDYLSYSGGVLTSSDGKLTESQHLDLFRLLLEDGGADITEPSGRYGTSALAQYHGPVSTFAWLLKQPSLEHSSYSSDGQLWHIWDTRFRSAWPNCADLIRETLPNRQVDENISKRRNPDGYTFLHKALMIWCDKYYYSMEAEFEVLLREAIRAGSDLHAVSLHGYSPLAYIMHDDTVNRNRRVLRKIINRWLEILEDLHINVDEYCEKEIAIFNSIDRERELVAMGFHHRYVWIKWTEISTLCLDYQSEWNHPLLPLTHFWRGVGEWDHYGPHATDWCDCWVDDKTEVAYYQRNGDEELPNMPGGWITSVEESDESEN